MLQAGQDLPLDAEAAQSGVGIGAAFEQLDGYLHPEIVIPNCLVNGAHAAPADLTGDLVTANSCPDQGGAFVIEVRPKLPNRRSFQNAALSGVGGQQRLQLAAQFLIVAAHPVQKHRPIGGREIGGLVEQLFDASLSVVFHNPPGASQVTAPATSDLVAHHTPRWRNSVLPRDYAIRDATGSWSCETCIADALTLLPCNTGVKKVNCV